MQWHLPGCLHGLVPKLQPGITISNQAFKRTLIACHRRMHQLLERKFITPPLFVFCFFDVVATKRSVRAWMCMQNDTEGATLDRAWCKHPRCVVSSWPSPTACTVSFGCLSELSIKHICSSARASAERLQHGSEKGTSRPCGHGKQTSSCRCCR